ncbi:hypothetical protein GCM10027280_54900 [Micromonospora polyrhachis]|uniref:Uncharacterized protein n=1 Tax=Micromonospora polyrhachis TaxID=1282883 RepID=A0A7W7WQ61_9ACTN|nr:hypothetical protein [Micromonospora polyrhachis]MBB4959690.1 hypothetical protein [Micromonospora polyrhachis]
MSTGTDAAQETSRTPIGIGLAGGCMIVVVAAIIAAAVFPGDAIPGRLLIVAVVVGGYAAVVPDLRATIGVAGVAALVFTGFLANRYGELTTRDGDVWWYAALIGFAALLGRAQRWMTSR